MNDLSPLGGGSSVDSSGGTLVSDDVINNNLDSTDPAKAPENDSGGGDDSSPGFDMEEFTTNKPAIPIIKPGQKKPTAKLPTNTRVAKDDELKDEVSEEEGESEDENQEAEEVAEEEQSTDSEETEETDKGNEEAGTKPKSRDYTGLPQEVEKALKKMNNREFNLIAPHVKKLVGEATQTKTQLAEAQKLLAGKGVPANWYDNPQAYTLSPEYIENYQQYQAADREFKFYQQQLNNIKSGQEYRYIQSYDKDGNPILSGPIKPTNEAEIQISTGLMDIQSVKAEARNKIAGLQKDFRGRYDHTVGEIKKQVDGYVNSMEEALRPKDEQRKVMSDLLGPTHKDHPLAYLAENLYALSVNLAEEIVKLRGGKQKAAQVNNDKRKAGPVTGKISKPGGSGKSSGPTVTLPNGRKVAKEIDLSDMDE